MRSSCFVNSSCVESAASGDGGLGERRARVSGSKLMSEDGYILRDEDGEIRRLHENGFASRVELATARHSESEGC